MKINIFFFIIIVFSVIAIKGYEKEIEGDLNFNLDDEDNNNNKQNKIKEKHKEKEKYKKKIDNKKKQHQSKKKLNYIEDSDEFDDLGLLNQMHQEEENKQKIKNQGRGIPHQFNIQYNQHRQEREIIKEEEIIPSNEFDKVKFWIIENYDYFFMVFTAFFIINILIGKIINSKISYNWLKANRKLFTDNYAHLGDKREYNEKDKYLLSKRSYNSFHFYASGRIHINWVSINITLKKRQDLMRIIYSLFTSSEKDYIIYHASIVPSFELPIVFAICQRKEEKIIINHYQDVNFFTNETNINFMSNNIIMLSENAEFVTKLFNEPNVMKYYMKVEDYIDTIYFTDRKTFVKEDYAIMFSFNMKNKIRDIEILKEINIFVHIVIDVLCSINVKNSYKKDALMKRKTYQKKRNKDLLEIDETMVKTGKINKEKK